MTLKLWPCLLILAVLVAPVWAAKGADPMDEYNVVWKSPSADSSGSMPLGNGDIGLNLWVEQSGDLVFYISKTDAWDERGELVKLGRVRVKLTPSLFQLGKPFVQTLRLRQGEVEIVGAETTLRVWVDANAPVIRVQAEGKSAFGMQASLELWRGKDTVVPAAGNRLTWFHRNESSVWQSSLKHQDMGGWIAKGKYPLMHRTFGCSMTGDGLVSVDDRTLVSSKPRDRFALSVYVHTSQTETPEKWLEQAREVVSRADKIGLEKSHNAHLKWWNEFWNRSWIRVSYPQKSAAPKDTDEPRMDVTSGYVLQRYITACAGRGIFPIKFNGSLFTVDSNGPGDVYDPDYRRWGPEYWFQNTRLSYWPMLASGDLEMMEPLFRMYLDAMPMARLRTRTYFGHPGVFFPETMSFWGTYRDGDYGSDRTGLKPGDVVNTYIKRYWQGALELVAMMLDRYAYREDRQFLDSTLLPLADGIIAFYDHHYKRDGNGKIVFEPAGSLETWQKAVNPLPEIAGLSWVLDGLLGLPTDVTGGQRRSMWSRLKGELPPVPVAVEDGKKRILPAEKVLEEAKNCENPELYCVFPYRLYGVGKPDLDAARNTFTKRITRASTCWSQDDTQAAYLGMADEASKILVNRFSQKHPGSRFPAFWGPNYDWIPDQDHGGNGVMAVQTMLLQADGDKILLFPAWPKDWDVNFKLHAPHNTTVEGVYRGGKLDSLKVMPKTREKDVVICEAQ